MQVSAAYDLRPSVAKQVGLGLMCMMQNLVQGSECVCFRVVNWHLLSPLAHLSVDD